MMVSFFETLGACLDHEKEKENKVNELWKAMQVLAERCKTNETCRDCLFYADDPEAFSSCKLKLNTPDRWQKEDINIEKL